jgi:uncharacterized membrane protein YhaH (DUF805 family)
LGPVQAIKTCFAKSFQFSGRARRAEYWWFLPTGLSVPVSALWLQNMLWPDLHGLLRIAVFLFALLPLMAVTSRRLVDTGEAAIGFEIPAKALILFLVTCWGLGALSDWFDTALIAGADGPSGFGMMLVFLLGAVFILPFAIVQLCVGFASGSALFGQMTAPSNTSFCPTEFNLREVQK